MDEDELPPPVAPPVPEPPQPDGRRLWIGNLDTRITEYKFLKMVEKFGTLAEFDFLYQKTGGDKGDVIVGIPRGYAFVTYQKAESAQSAQRTLDGLEVVGRRLAVKWAHLQDQTKFLTSRKPPSKPAPAVLSVKTRDPAAVAAEANSSNSLTERIATVEAALSALSSSTTAITVAADTGRDAVKPTYVTYKFIERKSNRPDQSSFPRRSSYRPYSKYNRPHRK